MLDGLDEPVRRYFAHTIRDGAVLHGRRSTPRSRVRIDDDGAIRTVSAERWGNVGEKTFRYLPFGGEIHAERRFGDLVLPCTAIVGRRFGTAGYAPFFNARIEHVCPYDALTE